LRFSDLFAYRDNNPFPTDHRSGNQARLPPATLTQGGMKSVVDFNPEAKQPERRVVCFVAKPSVVFLSLVIDEWNEIDCGTQIRPLFFWDVA